MPNPYRDEIAAALEGLGIAEDGNGPAEHFELPADPMAEGNQPASSPVPTHEAFGLALAYLGVEQHSTWGLWIMLARLARRITALEAQTPRDQEPPNAQPEPLMEDEPVPDPPEGPPPGRPHDLRDG